MVADAEPEREFWELRAAAWERRSDEMERFSAIFVDPAMDLLAVGPGDTVVDIGCGPGTTAIELSQRVSPGGRVLGVDIAEGMIAAARRRVAHVGAAGLDFVVADIERGPVAEGADAVYSRFGLMFFPDPTAAFANLVRSLRPGGRLAGSVWGDLGDNPWMFVPTLAATPVLGADLALPGPGEPGPFSLADPARLEELLVEAGFVDVIIEARSHARELHGDSVDDEVRTLLEVGPVGEAFDRATEATRQAAVQAVIEAIEPFRQGDGWALPGSAWIGSARLPAENG